ncbi:hypothetical protein ID866_1766 [Astraeus odoratus]|nr:hypothetical protein ID866_1766 [Astraeus odoratus]
MPVLDTSAITAALMNPYAQSNVVYGMSPHYYQAYLQAASNQTYPGTTPEGYSLSSTYVPGREKFHAPRNQPLPEPDRCEGRPPAPREARVITNPLTYGSWYQPGNCRCQRYGCPFIGSQKSVEIHMMDRHFIFPPGWKKNKDDWDADPSLKGKPVPIQGTAVLLDTPEAIDAWIAERRKRFPTAQRVEDKKRKLDEALARGQLAPEDMGLARMKRHRTAQSTDRSTISRAHRGKRGGSRGMGRGRVTFRQPSEPPSGVNGDKPAASITHAPQSNLSTDSEPEEDGPPEEASSKVPPADDLVSTPKAAEGPSTPQEPFHKPQRPLQPRKRSKASFVSRPALLLDNDFLEDVELRPGEAHQKMIEVVGSTDTQTSPTPEDLPEGLN